VYSTSPAPASVSYKVSTSSRLAIYLSDKGEWRSDRSRSAIL